MTRGAHELAGEIKRQAKPVIAEVQVQLLDMLGLDAFLRPPPDLRRQRLDQVLRESERLAYRSEEHTSELQSLMRISYAVFCLKKKKNTKTNNNNHQYLQ